MEHNKERLHRYIYIIAAEISISVTFEIEENSNLIDFGCLFIDEFFGV